MDRLRRALGRAGIVDGYRLTCRRKGCGFKENRSAPTEERCPKCNMRLWVSTIPRPLRFYDLRHTHATLLRRAGVDLGAVQKNLGHSTPDITAGTYDHSDAEDFRQEIERALSFGLPTEVNATSMQASSHAHKDEAPGAEAFASDSEGLRWSGRQDLNLRPLGPERW
ncbi:MAG TPA: tyrosine-type recombinase/integrase [Anaeromyxobacteraceae bacterium]|nr:tyrosine-type recombinase/integrase [Anaeromyxobacteraceae bacterium]